MEVRTHEYKTAEAPEELGAVFGPCIGIGAIYEKKGYLLHSHAVGGGFRETIKPIFDDLLRDVIDKTRLKIYVAGCSLDGYCQTEMLEGRQLVLEAIENAGFNDCVAEIRWAKNFSSQELTLILEEGRAEIEDIEDIDNY